MEYVRNTIDEFNNINDFLVWISRSPTDMWIKIINKSDAFHTGAVPREFKMLHVITSHCKMKSLISLLQVVVAHPRSTIF